MNTEKQVALTVCFRGAQTSRGTYNYFKSKTEEGEKEGVSVEKRPSFAQVSKQITLKDQFIEGALMEPPTSMKMKPKLWNSFSENKRIGIHVMTLVKEMYPDRISYSYEII